MQQPMDGSMIELANRSIQRLIKIPGMSSLSYSVWPLAGQQATQWPACTAHCMQQLAPSHAKRSRAASFCDSNELHQPLRQMQGSLSTQSIDPCLDNNRWGMNEVRATFSGEKRNKKEEVDTTRPSLDCKFFYSLSITSNLWTHVWSIKYR